MILHRLTVEGRDFFLPDPVTDLRNQILAAIKDGGGYVNIPPLRGGSGIDILFSPGMAVTWTQLDVGGEAAERGEDDGLGHATALDDL
ncbi:MAG: hypothetical protein JWP66_626 [Naasia sp.]|nr:hypothetical protein [Naasia sp.]